MHDSIHKLFEVLFCLNDVFKCFELLIFVCHPWNGGIHVMKLKRYPCRVLTLIADSSVY